MSPNLNPVGKTKQQIRDEMTAIFDARKEQAIAKITAQAQQYEKKMGLITVGLPVSYIME